MEDSLYNRLYDINFLRRGWHLTRNESRNDFISDPFRYNDFAYNLEDNLRSISEALKQEQYHPKPLLLIDVPKSNLSVRPGSVICIEDRIVLFSIIDLIASKLDKRLPENVYSYRLKEKKDSKSLFKDLEILKYPFLKRATVQKRVSIIEPWYGQWPKFYKKAIYVYEVEGYQHLTISDVSAYYENIDINILRDMILLKYFPKEQKIINLLCNFLEYWTWPTKHGLTIRRGIPQASDVCNFLGNVYLLPLDEEFIRFSNKRNIKYLRYGDDIKIFSKEKSVALEALFLMNNVLRSIHLNIQGSKTQIYENDDIREEIYSAGLEEVNKVISSIQRNLAMTQDERDEYIQALKKIYRTIPKKNKIITNKNLTLYRRLITGFMLLGSSYMLDNLLRQLSINPDQRLLYKASNYLIIFPKSSKKISKNILEFLTSSVNVFPYQEGHLISILGKLRSISDDAIEYAKRCLKLKRKHWYVRVESAALLANLNLKLKSLKTMKKLYSEESNIEIRRALVKCLCQLKEQDQLKFIQEVNFENHYKLSYLGRMLIHLYYDHNNSAETELSRLFQKSDEDLLLESYYKIDVIKYCRKKIIKQKLLKQLRGNKKSITKEHLRLRVDKTIKIIEKNLENN